MESRRETEVIWRKARCRPEESDVAGADRNHRHYRAPPSDPGEIESPRRGMYRVKEFSRARARRAPHDRGSLPPLQLREAAP